VVRRPPLHQEFGGSPGAPGGCGGATRWSWSPGPASGLRIPGPGRVCSGQTSRRNQLERRHTRNFPSSSVPTRHIVWRPISAPGACQNRRSHECNLPPEVEGTLASHRDVVIRQAIQLAQFRSSMLRSASVHCRPPAFPDWLKPICNVAMRTRCEMSTAQCGGLQPKRARVSRPRAPFAIPGSQGAEA